MWKMDSDQKSIPVGGFLNRNDCDVLRAKTGVYRQVTHRTIIPPTLSTCRGSGGGCCWRGNRLGWVGSSCDTWKNGWTEGNWHGRQRVMEWGPGFPITAYGPRFFSERFLD